MPMFLSRKTPKTEFVAPEFYKDWANASAEIDRLGARLDSVRSVLSAYRTKKQKATWSYTHWRQVEAIVLRKWKNTVRLKDVGLRQAGKITDDIEIDYSWWEVSDEVRMWSIPVPDFLDGLVNRNYSDLNWSWEKAREEKLQKARQGLA